MIVHPQAFRKEIVVGEGDIDAQNHVNNVVYLQWIQEISRSHWESVTPAEQQQKYIWVVRRHEIDYLRQAKLGDTLQAYTWPCFGTGSSSVRHVVLKNKATGKTVMESATTWVMLDGDTLKPAEIPQEVKNNFIVFTKQFSNTDISFACKEDAEAIVQLLNAAYRGNSAKKGWTHEADLISGSTRTVKTEVEGLISNPVSVFLIYKDENAIGGCVNLKQIGRKVYLGMLAVNPERQASGTGKMLLQAAEEFADTVGAEAIYMTVISLRTELIAWYSRHGYVDAGERVSFEEDEVSGKHLQELEFAVLEKQLKN